uniref:Uncharacterized protein n=1 Tax=Anguilla anguilla TaxID=7936 RepID=A0A0E9TU11_ANGAN
MAKSTCVYINHEYIAHIKMCKIALQNLVRNCLMTVFIYCNPLCIGNH